MSIFRDFVTTGTSPTTNMNDTIFVTGTDTGSTRSYTPSSIDVRRETEKQKEAIKEEVKKWMTEDVQIAVAKEAGQLFQDIQELRKEKEEIADSIFFFKKEMTEIKKEVQAEMKSMEEMLEKYANQILRYQNMDL